MKLQLHCHTIKRGELAGVFEHFVVVDLESTGTKWADGDRIIQVGCAVIEHQQIVQQFSQLVNPHQLVAPEVLALTGLTQAELDRAPDFKDITTKIQPLLKGRVFVAHNVEFDLPFLNAELSAAGSPIFSGLAIDTVELAQVLLPLAPSYKLTDLARYLNLTHDNPHQADSDADTTGQLLLVLLKRLKSLPTETVTQLAAIGQALAAQTNELFKWIAAQHRQPYLPDYLVKVGSFVLRRPVSWPASASTLTFSEGLPSADQLAALFKQQGLQFRSEQQSMIKFVDQEVQKGTPSIIEAPTGTGKTLGYLLPLAYRLKDNQQAKLVISVNTRALQNQIKQSVYVLNDLIGQSLHVVSIKSATHYLDLARFERVLRFDRMNRHTALNSMRLLVWLLTTTTGDLDELKLTTYQNWFFQMVNHLPVTTEFTNYSGLDFWNRLMRQVHSADIVVTNHAYLAQHYSDLVTHDTYLVIDEAHHFADDFARVRRQKLSTYHLQHMLTKLSHWTVFDQMSDLIIDAQQHVANVQDLIALSLTTPTVREPIFLTLHQTDELARLIVPELNTILTVVTKCLDHLAATQLETPLTDKQELLRFDLDQAEVTLADLLARFNYQGEKGMYIDPDDDDISLRLNWQDPHVAQKLANLWTLWAKVYFVGATLSVQGSCRYFCQQLGLSDDSQSQLLLTSSWSPLDHIQFLIPQTTQTPNQDGSQYNQWLIQTLIPLLQETPVQTMILFNALSSVREVYEGLLPHLGYKRELLAQGVTGSNEKIAKRFHLSQAAILLGAHSFWEGMDYPDDELRLLIITRLPFESPQDPTVHYRYDVLQHQGFKPFYDDALPRATLKLRQGLGRLVRNPHDYGSLVMLDHRLAVGSYANYLQNALTLSGRLLSTPNDSLGTQVTNFLKMHQ